MCGSRGVEAERAVQMGGNQESTQKIIEKIDEFARDRFAFVAGFCIDFNFEAVIG
jgi:hypothetical protein